MISEVEQDLCVTVLAPVIKCWTSQSRVALPDIFNADSNAVRQSEVHNAFLNAVGLPDILGTDSCVVRPTYG